MNQDVINSVEVVCQTYDFTGDRHYRCRKCFLVSDRVKNGEELRKWIESHECGGTHGRGIHEGKFFVSALTPVPTEEMP